MPLDDHVMRSIKAAGINPFPAPHVTRIAKTIDSGPTVFRDLGPIKFQRRIFPSVSFRKSRSIVDDFTEFTKGRSKSDLRMWNFRPLSGKVPVWNLRNGVREFGLEIGDAVEHMRSQFKVSVHLCAIHIKMDDQKELFDVHAHVILSVKDNEEAARQYLKSKFYETHSPADSVRSGRGAASYLLKKIYDYEGISTWPREAVRAAWELSGTNLQLVRTYENFAKWRSSLAREAGASKSLLPKGRIDGKAPTASPGYQCNLLIGAEIRLAHVMPQLDPFTAARETREQASGVQDASLAKRPAALFRPGGSNLGLNGLQGGRTEVDETLAFVATIGSSERLLESSTPIPVRLPGHSGSRSERSVPTACLDARARAGSFTPASVSTIPKCNPLRSSQPRQQDVPWRKRWCLRAWPFCVPGRFSKAVRRRM